MDTINHKRPAAKAVKRMITYLGAYCSVCGFSDIRALNLHHVVEWAKGGSSGKKNLQVLCANCHAIAHRK